MEVTEGSARIGLWFVHVRWSGRTVYQVRFATTPLPGPVPVLVRQYLSGRPVDLTTLVIGIVPPGETTSRIYEEVRKIPYGETATYGEIACRAGTSPRAVGQAMKRNPVPLVIPCHRVVSRSGPGGFSPDPEIKILLLSLEKKNKRRFIAESPRVG
jgi:methylated-DNA-[protein]-cysteine S-methyltransferase